MITLYHGGLDKIERPEIREPNRTLDFGSGFYLTSSVKQAEDWVKRRLTDGCTSGFVNIYRFPAEEAKKNLKIKIFDSPSEDWLDFVMANRRIPGYTHGFDIVAGPVADDRVYTAFALFEGGTISKDILIRELKTYRLVDQYLFHTEAALAFLEFIKAEEITR